MASREDEVRDLKEKNSELVQEVQFWKMTAAQREKEKLDLMKELNDLRLKLSRLRSGGAAEARKLDAQLQSAGEEALTHLVQASGAVARSIELAKQYMRNRQELDLQAPRWSNLSEGTPPHSDSKVNKVPPMSIGGQSIQPVVALRRTLLQSSARLRSPNQNATERAVPMHMLQDVYIPLTRIDMAEMQMSSDSDIDNSTDDLGLQETSETFEESQNNTTEDMNETRRLDDVIEEAELEEEQERGSISYTARIENPLEGPSWLLDRPQTANVQTSRGNLEPDSTTHSDQPPDDAEKENEPLSVTLTFTPTVRRRKRTSPPPAPLSPLSPQASSPRQRHNRAPNNNRVLKVVVAKMRLSNEQQDGSPPKIAKLIAPRTKDTQRRSTIDSPSVSPRSPAISPRRPSESCTQRDCNRARLDEPSPNGSTDAGVVVLATHRQNNVTHRRRAIYSDSDVSDDGSDAGADVKANENIMDVSDDGNDLSDNDINVSPKIRKRRNTQHLRNHSEGNVSERHNANRRDGNDDSESDGDVSEHSECDDDLRIGNDRETLRGNTSNQNVKGDGDHRNANDPDSSENEEFRGFTNESRSGRDERDVSDSHDKNKNVTQCRGKNTTNSRGKNTTNSRGKNTTNSRGKNVNNSRDKNASVAKRNTSERLEASVTERSGNSRHDITQMSESNVSGRRKGKSVTKRYTSDRQDGNVSENSTSCQSHEVDSDTSNNDSEWGAGRSRRNKRKVTYTEVPLNRKMRR